MKKTFILFALGIAVASCSTLTPSAERETPTTLKITDLEARMIRIERVVDNQSLIQLASELDQIRADTKALRGELEQLRYETENNASRQRELYVDVDRRLQALETSSPRAATSPPAGGGFAAEPTPPPAPARTPVAQPPPVAAAPAPVAAARPTPSGSDQQNYQAAFDLVQARKFPEATKAFNDFLAAFPSSPLADNAQYWLGETYYVQRQFNTALPEFKKVVDLHPKSAKLPDAMLKVGYCEVELGNKDVARATFQQVMKQFPDTTAARLASQRLERLAN